MMDNNRERERDRSKRGDKPSRFSDAARDRSMDRGGAESRRLFVSNIPYEYRWTELKDLFKAKVGDVAYVELFNDDNGKPMGCGVVEFSTSDAMKKALTVMHRFDLNGRKLVLKEETGNERARHMGRPGGGGGGGAGAGGPSIKGRPEKNWGPQQREPENFNTYGLNLQFLESINVQPPLGKKVFVANLDYKADRAKIKEVFKLAGKVRNIDLAVDKDGNSKGYAVIDYDHPVEAVQAISMFDKQMLFERKMTVRMDKGQSDRSEPKLPEGLKGIGVGLGPNGEPLRDVARNIAQNQAGSAIAPSGTGSLNSASVLGPVPNAGVSLNGLGAGLANPLAANSALGGGLGLQALGLTGLGALQNQLLQSGLTANDLASVIQAQAANLNTASIGLGGQDLSAVGSGGMSNNMMSSSSVMGAGNHMNSGPMSSNMHGASRQMSSMSSGQHYGGGRDNGAPKTKKSDMVVISNLPSTVTWQLIREKFSECGEVKFAEMTGVDTAIVRFYSEWEAERAINVFDRTRIDGRTISVNFF